VLFFECRVYTPSEAAHRLGLTPARVRQLMAAGRLPHRRTPLGRLLDADAVDALALARSGRCRPQGEVAP
jgi:excisionase family DNA binding protein